MLKPIVRCLLSGFSALLLVVPLQSGAASLSAQVDHCLKLASHKHGVAYVLLLAIAEQESGFNPLAVRKPLAAGNLDGSTDYGLMQINSVWLPTLRRYGLQASQLFDPCTNADVGAWILADNFKRLGMNWNAVGAYNAQTQWKRVKYAVGVHAKVQRYLASTPVPRSSQIQPQGSVGGMEQTGPTIGQATAVSQMSVMEPVYD